MDSKNTNAVIGAITYTFFLIIISFLIVSFSSFLHSPYLESDTAIDVDKSISSFLFSGDQDKISFLSDKEISHMKDVRRLLIIFSFLALLLLRASLYSWFNKSPFRKVRWYFKNKKKKLSKEERLAIVLTPFGIISFLSFAQLFLSKAFHELFLAFHLLFFPKGNFIFSFDSVLISTYPESFFLSMTILAITIFVSLSSFLFLLYIVRFIKLKRNLND